MKGSFKISFYIFGFVLDSCIEIWRFFLKFGGILANKKLKKHLILALLILIYFLAIYSQQIKVCNQHIVISDPILALVLEVLWKFFVDL